MDELTPTSLEDTTRVSRKGLDSLLSELRRVKEQLASDTPGQCRDCPGGKSWEDEATRLREENEKNSAETTARFKEAFDTIARLREIEKAITNARVVGFKPGLALIDSGSWAHIVAVTYARNALQPQTEKGEPSMLEQGIRDAAAILATPTQTEKEGGETHADSSRGA